MINVSGRLHAGIFEFATIEGAIDGLCIHVDC